jgi:hypothetical protein
VLPARPEFKVDDDFAVGTVAVDSFEESEVRKLAFERRRNSLKNGMLSRSMQNVQGHADGIRKKEQMTVAAQHMRLTVWRRLRAERGCMC